MDSKPGKVLIKDNFIVSTKIIKAIKEIIKTTKYEKKLIDV